jgi:hypothetical protein
MSFGRSIVHWNDANMSCDKARESIADALFTRTATSSDVQAHLAICAECRAYGSDCEKLWEELPTLSVPTPKSKSRRELGGLRPRPLFVGPAGWLVRPAILAAGLLLAALLGYGVAQVQARTATSVGATATDSTPEYLLLLYDSGVTGASVSTQQVSAIIAEYSAWADGLRAAGQLVSAEKLSDSASVWLGGSIATVSGERVGGFFLIRARDLIEAQRIAASCPHLKHGGRIELRPIQPT